jgi:glycosyltransferase involved in cell wall biosynthesis
MSSEKHAEGILVSVITPVYNGEKFICEVLKSIADSTYRPLELIVVNDGSTDSTLIKIQDQVSELSIPLKVIDIPNAGEANAVNTGLKYCNGKYISIVNADDPIKPHLFDRTVSALEANDEYSVAYPDWEMIDKDGRVIRNVRTQEFSNRALIANFICLPGPGALIRTSSLGQMELRNSRFKYVSDYDLWLRISLVGPFVRVPEILATWRNHAEGATYTSKGAGQVKEMIDVITLFFDKTELPNDISRFRGQAMAHAFYFAAIQSLYSRNVHGRRLLLKSFKFRFRRQLDDRQNRRRFIIIMAIIMNPLGRILVRWRS